MSFFSPLSLFRSGPQPGTTQPTVNQPLQSQPQPGQVAPPNPTDPGAPAPATPPANQPSPNQTLEDKLKDLWSPPSDKDPQPQNFDPSKLFDFTPQQLAEKVGQINFASALTPETLQAVTAGGEGAVQALAEALNKVAQTTFTQSLTGAKTMIESAFAKASGSIDARVQQQIKRQTVSNNLRETNPLFNDPKFAPIVGAIETQLTNKFPQASPAEITEMARQYFDSLAGAAAGKPTEPAQPAGPKGEDWESFFGVKITS